VESLSFRSTVVAAGQLAMIVAKLSVYQVGVALTHLFSGPFALTSNDHYHDNSLSTEAEHWLERSPAPTGEAAARSATESSPIASIRCGAVGGMLPQVAPVD